MTTAYAMIDLAPDDTRHAPAGAVTVPETRGGCGVCHEITLDGDGRPVITCGQCAPVLIGSHYGWSATPHGVPLTPDQNAARELAKRDAEAGQNQLLTAVVADFMERRIGGARATVGSVAAPDPPSLADALKGVSAEELLAALPDEVKAALAAEAGAPVVEKAKPGPKTRTRAAH